MQRQGLERERTQMTKTLFMYHLFRLACELNEFILLLILLLANNTLFFAAPLLYIIIND